jgi:hypothetical protein
VITYDSRPWRQKIIGAETVDGKEDKAKNEVADHNYELKIDGPDLLPPREFWPQYDNQAVTLTRAAFEQVLQDRYKEFYDDRYRKRWLVNKKIRGHRQRPQRSWSPIDSGVVELLYQQAVSDSKRKAAWIEAMSLVKSKKFKRSVAYMVEEKDRVSTVVEMLSAPMKENPPSWTSDWHRARFGAAVDLCSMILFELDLAQRCLQGMSDIAVDGRTKIKTHLLKEAQEPIQRAINKNRNVVSLELIVAAYAYAADLVVHPGKIYCNPVKAVANEISRLSKPGEDTTAAQDARHRSIQVALINQLGWAWMI